MFSIINIQLKYYFFFLISISGLSAILFDFFEVNSAYYITKPLTTAIIVLFPLYFYGFTLKPYVEKIIIGLCFCLIGDVFLLFDSFFIYGLGSFLIGHIFFLYAFVKEKGWHWPLLPGIFLFVLGFSILSICFKNLGKYFFPVLLYILLILLMSWQAIALQINDYKKNFNFVGWASVFFLISDSIIALNRFYIEFKYSKILILTFYWFSISLLSYSTIKPKD